jgi:hypothetical protein
MLAKASVLVEEQADEGARVIASDALGNMVEH